ncbi:MAG: 50S ribosomal protein L31e [Candidatus Micrarchaeota archaeon]|nr:50S ribosomal protein L31e [Candidatus Micrarchaeota archaeon]
MAEATDNRKLERIYTVPLRKAFDYLRTRRVERAVKLVRAFVSRHFKVEEKNVRISEGVNSLLWRDSIQKPPRRIKIRGVLADGKVKAWLVGEEEELKRSSDEAKKKADEKAKKKEAQAAARKDKPAAAAKPVAPAPASKPAESKPAPAKAVAPTAGNAPKSAPSAPHSMPASRKQI